MHSAPTPRAERPVGKQARDQEKQCISGQEVICYRVGLTKGDDDTNEADDGEANADHGGGHGEDVDRNVLLEMIIFLALPSYFSFHATVFRLLAKPTVQRITGLIRKTGKGTMIA